MSRSLARRPGYQIEGLSDSALLVTEQSLRTIRSATARLAQAIERVPLDTAQDCNALSLVIARTVDTLAKLQPREATPTVEEFVSVAESLQRVSSEMLRRTKAIDVTPKA